MLSVRASERVVIYVVDTIDLERLQYDTSFDPRLTYVTVVDGTTVDPADKLKGELDRRGLLIPGSTLVQNPYRPDEYATISDAAGKYALDKFFIFSNLCQLLGARSVQMKSVEETLDGRTRTLTAASESKVAKVAEGSVKAESTATEKILEQKVLHENFHGGEPHIEDARELLHRLRLDDDPILRSLVDSRAIPVNPHKSRQISVDLSRETDGVLSLAAQVTTPAFFKLSVDASQVVSRSVHLKVEYTIEF